MGAILSNFPSQQGYIDFDDVKAAVLLSLDLLVPELLPGGKRVGKNWVVCNPTRDDKSASFSVSMETGAWFDFATKDRGKNFIGLVMYITGESAVEIGRLLECYVKALEVSELEERLGKLEKVVGHERN